MNGPGPRISSPVGSIDPRSVVGMQALRSGLELARASQLTMLRLQLALHKSNRRTAMQALDDLLDIDAEMEGLAATLTDVPTPLAGDAALSGFIGLQKAAIAVEKHVLTGGDWRSDATPPAIVAPEDGAGGADLRGQPPLPEEMGQDDRTGSRRWMHVLAIVIVVALIGFGLMAYLWPTFPVTLGIV